MKIQFSKFHGAGNDFIIIDGRQDVELNEVQVRWLCDRHFGIGADGLIIVREPTHPQAHIRWDFYNSDGSRAEMCGNGARCLARFVSQQLGFKGPFVLQTAAGLVRLRYINDLIGVELTPPQQPILYELLDSPQAKLTLHCINTGVPHTVVFVDQVEQIDVVTLGRMIRRHERFAPAGTNVNFVQVLSKQSIQIRTYERGVEDETLACGTGVTASALIASKIYKWPSPVHVRVKSGDRLQVVFEESQSGWKRVELIGPAVHVFDGVVEI